MPNVIASPRGQSTGQVLTEFVDSVGTTSVTYTYPTVQEKLWVRNTGLLPITVTIGGDTQTIQRGERREFTAEFTSFSINSSGGVQSFEATADKKGSVFSSPEGRYLSSLPIGGGGFPWPSDLVAFWDFSETSAPFLAKSGVDRFPLMPGTSTPTSLQGAPFGGGLIFNGSTDYLQIASENVGALHVGKSGDEVTVVAWIKRGANNVSSQSAVIAGLWQEDDSNPKREYALFSSLPLYGGAIQACGHVSKTGGASPNIPYSRDYSANGRLISKDVMRCIAFTYDGAQITSYMDGIADSRPTYTEVGAPDGEGLTYAKNPYLFDQGLNRVNPNSPFTVGAVKRIAGMDNFFNGEIYGLAVFRRALTPKEVLKVHIDALTGGQPFLYNDFFVLSGGSTPCKDFGYKSARGATAIDTTANVNSWCLVRIISGVPSFMARSNTVPSGGTDQSTTSAIFVMDTIHDMKFSQLGRVDFTLNNALAGDTVRLCVCVNGQWYATATEYDHPGGGTGSDWSTGIVRSVTIGRDKTQWLSLTYTPGTALTLGAQPASNIPNGAFTGFGFLSKPMQVNGLIRITDAKLYS